MKSQLKVASQHIHSADKFNQIWTPINWHHEVESELFPLSTNHTWNSLGSLIKEHGLASAVLSMLPSVWQIEPVIYNTCRKHRIPNIDIMDSNWPVLLAHLHTVDIGGLILSADQESNLIEWWPKIKSPPSFIVVIHTSPETIHEWAIDAQIYHELHLVAGFPLFYQDTEVNLKQDRIWLKHNPDLGWSDTQHSWQIKIMDAELDIELSLPKDAVKHEHSLFTF